MSSWNPHNGDSILVVDTKKKRRVVSPATSTAIDTGCRLIDIDLLWCFEHAGKGGS